MDETSDDYAKFIESMSHHCHCSPPHARPCDGVLAGGLCDNMGNRDNDYHPNLDGPAEPVGLRDNVLDLFRELEQEGAITRPPKGSDPAADALAPKHAMPPVVGTARDNSGHQPGRTNA